MLRRSRTIAAAAVALLGLVSCSDADDGQERSQQPDETATTTTTAAPDLLRILVTNDDGIGAVGIDVLVRALMNLDDVEVEVVAPAENQSGSSDRTTPGGAVHRPGETASGVEGTAVEGLPADSIAVALDELGLEPDLVVSGVNSGQNVGPLAYVSGTVGAAREAVRRGVPAIAGSAGLTEDTLEDYQLAAELIVAYIEQNRGSLAGSDGGDGVVSINVPDCTAGSPGELQQVALATDLPEGVNLFTTDCSAAPTGVPTDDVAALIAGFPSLSIVPPEAPGS